MLSYLDLDTWQVPFYYRSDARHPTVEITQKDDDDNGQPLKVEIARSHTMTLPAQTKIWSQISKHSFQNIYVHCNASKPVYVCSDMAQVIFTHDVNTQKQSVEDVQISHLLFYRLSQFEFRDLHIELRDNTGNLIYFQSGTVTTTLYFR